MVYELLTDLDWDFDVSAEELGTNGPRENGVIQTNEKFADSARLDAKALKSMEVVTAEDIYRGEVVMLRQKISSLENREKEIRKQFANEVQTIKNQHQMLLKQYEHEMEALRGSLNHQKGLLAISQLGTKTSSSPKKLQNSTELFRPKDCHFSCEVYMPESTNLTQQISEGCEKYVALARGIEILGRNFGINICSFPNAYKVIDDLMANDFLDIPCKKSKVLLNKAMNGEASAATILMFLVESMLFQLNFAKTPAHRVMSNLASSFKNCSRWWFELDTFAPLPWHIETILKFHQWKLLRITSAKFKEYGGHLEPFLEIFASHDMFLAPISSGLPSKGILINFLLCLGFMPNLASPTLNQNVYNIIGSLLKQWIPVKRLNIVEKLPQYMIWICQLALFLKAIEVVPSGIALQLPQIRLMIRLLANNTTFKDDLLLTEIESTLLRLCHYILIRQKIPILKTLGREAILLFSYINDLSRKLGKTDDDHSFVYEIQEAMIREFSCEGI